MRWLFHFAELPVPKEPFTRSASKMSRYFVADAHCGDRKRLVVHANEKLTAFMELDEAFRRSNP
jgi:hypothetical protein